jgi:hypothetical protein
MPKHSEILSALTDRTTWEDRQSTWYQMRHDGLRRRTKPFPNAADMHFPLIDMQLEKLKPVYVQQIFATDTIATFSALSADQAQYQAAASQWFDYHIKQHTNFEDEIFSGIDTMLLGGKAIVKVFWEPDKKRLQYEAVHPLHIIVPTGTEKLADADWIVHVQHFSKAQYKRRKDFRQEEEFMNTLCGKGEESEQLDTEKCRREGLTYGKNEETIVIWEVFERDEEGSWSVCTYSPVRCKEPVRAKFGLPYNKGLFAEQVPPFAELNAEIKDKGYYSGRGVAERLAPFEAALCKDWNTQKDYQTLTCTPMFSAKGMPQGSQNIRMVPGEILPFEVQAVQFPSMPMDIGMQMQLTRMTAEQSIATPDFGAMQTGQGQKPRTATEMNMVGGMANQTMDLRARVFRRELGYLFRLSWSILVQYGQEALEFFFDGELGSLPAEAFSGKFLIEPSGSGDNINKQFVMQRAVARKQMFTGNPNIDQRELDKSVLEADDPRLVKRLLLNAGTQAAQQMEDQAQEISIMLLGFPAEVRQTDDDDAHVKSLAGFVQRRNQLKEPLSGEQMRLIAQHAATHMQAMKKKNPQAYQQNMQQTAPMFKELEQLANQVDQLKQQQQQQEQIQAQPTGDGYAADQQQQQDLGGAAA